eukprot:Tbor_TRINITY_DN2030_c0_g1::TRINITY_DN2030_c0_g1_i1::g.12156::m.12156/K17086/TM9SF2_4; transmembrane 9 superfamily member 2/4
MDQLSFYIIIGTLASAVSAFYVPGIQPIAYEEGQVVNILVNGLHSIKNVVPYDYYTAPFCRPNIIQNRHESLGEMLSGENMRPSAYFFHMKYDTNCKVSCVKNLEDKDASLLESLIEKEYRGYMVADNLPVFKNATSVYQGQCQKSFPQIPYQRGYALGVPKACTGDETLINNHLHFRVQYHRVEAGTNFAIGDSDIIDGEFVGRSNMKKTKKIATDDEERYLIVGITAEPFSIKWPNVGEDGTVSDCDLNSNPMTLSSSPLTTKHRGSVAWTYGVTWVEEPNIRWASRWDSFLKTSFADTNNSVHVISIINTIMIVICLISTVSASILRALRKDIARYNMNIEFSKDEEKEMQREETGWKVIANDVFRTPKYSMFLCICVSNGLQVTLMVLGTMALSLFGILSPAMRGGIMTCTISFFVVLASVNGYVVSRMHLKFGGEKKWSLIFKSASLLPGVTFVCFITSNILLRSVRSSGSVPFAVLLSILSMWLLVAIPLALVGASIGWKSAITSHPKKVNAIPRPINPNLERPYLKPHVVLCFSGILPAAALFMEARFILASVWMGVVYYVFGFLTVVFILWMLTVAITSIVVVYMKLCAENYHWWWISFLAPASFGVHIFLYFVYYFYTLSITSKIATAIYFIYMGLATFAYTLSAGAIGFFATWAFVEKIYNSVKTE